MVTSRESMNNKLGIQFFQIKQLLLFWKLLSHLPEYEACRKQLSRLFVCLQNLSAILQSSRQRFLTKHIFSSRKRCYTMIFVFIVFGSNENPFYSRNLLQHFSKISKCGCIFAIWKLGNLRKILSYAQGNCCVFFMASGDVSQMAFSSTKSFEVFQFTYDHPQYLST